MDAARIGRAVAVGLLGTAAITAAQALAGDTSSGDPDEGWDAAPAPAKVARKALGLVGVDPPPSWIPVLTQAMHWGYGTAWGAGYALARGRGRAGSGTGNGRGGTGNGRSGAASAREAVALGLLVWAASYAELVPLGVYEPPWHYDARTHAKDIGFHLAFGAGTVAAARAIA